MNLKAGLTNSTDVQVTIPTYQEHRYKNSAEDKKGFGNTILRVKHNIFGNDYKDIALGIIPALVFPTAGANMSNGDTEGSFAVLLGVHLPKNWYGKFRTEVFHLRRPDDNGWQTNHALVSCFSYSWTEKISSFFEFYKMSSDNKNAKTYSALDLGVLYLINPNFQLDAGSYIGLTEAAEDYRAYFGFSLRH